MIRSNWEEQMRERKSDMIICHYINVQKVDKRMRVKKKEIFWGEGERGGEGGGNDYLGRIKDRNKNR